MYDTSGTKQNAGWPATFETLENLEFFSNLQCSWKTPLKSCFIFVLNCSKNDTNCEYNYEKVNNNEGQLWWGSRFIVDIIFSISNQHCEVPLNILCFSVQT